MNSSPRKVEPSTGTSEPERFDAIVIGAGVGGLYAIYRLRKLGLRRRGRRHLVLEPLPRVPLRCRKHGVLVFLFR